MTVQLYQSNGKQFFRVVEPDRKTPRWIKVLHVVVVIGWVLSIIIGMTQYNKINPFNKSKWEKASYLTREELIK